MGFPIAGGFGGSEDAMSGSIDGFMLDWGRWLMLAPESCSQTTATPKFRQVGDSVAWERGTISLLLETLKFGKRSVRIYGVFAECVPFIGTNSPVF